MIPSSAAPTGIRWRKPRASGDDPTLTDQGFDWKE